MSTPDLPVADQALLDKLNVAVAAANEAEKTSEAAKAEHVSRSRVVGQLLLEAKKRHPKVADFEAFLKRVNGLKLSRVYDYLRIAGGRATDEQLRQEARDRQKKSRENKKKKLPPPEKPTRAEPRQEPKPISVTDPDVTESVEASAERRSAENEIADLKADNAELKAQLQAAHAAPGADAEADSASRLQNAIEALIDAAKHTVGFENVLPRGVVYSKADLDTVISRLQSLNKSMANLRKASRAEAA